MSKIYALTDYQGYFGSKYNAIPYNSGMDKAMLEKYFLDFGYEIKFIEYSDIINYANSFWHGKPVIYTSTEDTNFHFKDFIEDIIYYLELCNARVIPSYKYLKANNNKVFMEMLRHQLNDVASNYLATNVFGCLEEAMGAKNSFNYPLVFKRSAGAMSEGVGIAENQRDLIQKLRRICRTPNYFREIWEFGRSLKYKKYKKESKFRNKFIIQNFIPGLNGDYKILIFSKKYYVLKRGIKKGDFRASGSGIRNYEKDIPEGLLEFAFNFFNELDVPNASLDIAFNGTNFFLLEFQCLYFGSFTLTYSDFYWQRKDEHFELIRMKSDLEKEYVRSVVEYINTK